MKKIKLLVLKSKISDHWFKKRPTIQYEDKKGNEWYFDILGSLFINTIGLIPHWVQYFLWKMGISWHDPINNLCTPGLDCCLSKNK